MIIPSTISSFALAMDTNKNSIGRNIISPADQALPVDAWPS